MVDNEHILPSINIPEALCKETMENLYLSKDTMKLKSENSINIAGIIKTAEGQSCEDMVDESDAAFYGLYYKFTALDVEEELSVVEVEALVLDLLQLLDHCVKKMGDLKERKDILKEMANILIIVGKCMKVVDGPNKPLKEHRDELRSSSIYLFVASLKLYVGEVANLVETPEGCRMLMQVIHAALFFCLEAKIRVRMEKEDLVPFYPLGIYKIGTIGKTAHYNALVDLLDQFKKVNDLSGLVSSKGREIYFMISFISASLDGRYEYLVHHLWENGLLKLPDLKGQPAFLSDPSLSTLFEVLFAASSPVQQGKIYRTYFKGNMSTFAAIPPANLCLCYLIYHWKNAAEFKFVFEEAIQLLKPMKKMFKFAPCLAEACQRLGLLQNQLCEAVESLYGLNTSQFKGSIYGPLPLHIACMSHFQTTAKRETKVPRREGMILLAVLVKTDNKYKEEVRTLKKNFIDLLSSCEGWHRVQQLVWDKKAKHRRGKKRPAIHADDNVELEEFRNHKRKKTQL